MLELPESYTLAAQLKESLRGKTVRSAAAAASPHKFAWYFSDPEGYGPLLAGRTVDDAYPVAGQVEIALGDVRLLFADGVNLRYFPAGVPRPDKHQLLVEFEDESALAATVQMYGGLWAFPAGANDNPYYLVAREKPSPLTAAFDRAWFDRLAGEEKPGMRVKALLAAGQRIPGLGNGVLQDILFRARIHPKSRIDALSPSEWDALYASIKDTLFDMAVRGGRDTERDLYGCPGGYATRLSAKTWKAPCPVCGGDILRQAYMGGNVYVCPRCQPLKE